MKLTGNTIFITGGGSGIGRALAEALQHLGNKVIISGRSKERLEETIQANPGMFAVELNVQDPVSIERAANHVIEQFPDLNVLINNAGIIQPDNAVGRIDEDVLVSTVATNLLGPIRLTSALIDHLKSKEEAVIINTTSILGFVPLAATAIYSATKAALHTYTLSQRYMLKDTSVKVIEIVPPWVQSNNDEPRAMPLSSFIDATLKLLGTDIDEVLVKEAEVFRNNPGPNEGVFLAQLNDAMQSEPPKIH
ncbi:SDR family oxidoreductase [Paenibacillus sp. FSL K6-1230]|uniref:SDR family oxidoreductase n=1 Tax=Paenibacillus sp. FSL K6-1230 TaxID=2921603 RepID=UPI0030F8E1C1